MVFLKDYLQYKKQKKIVKSREAEKQVSKAGKSRKQRSWKIRKLWKAEKQKAEAEKKNIKKISLKNTKPSLGMLYDKSSHNYI